MLMNVFDKYDIEKVYTIWSDDDKLIVTESGDDLISIRHYDMGDEKIGFLTITQEQAMILSDLLKDMADNYIEED